MQLRLSRVWAAVLATGLAVLGAQALSASPAAATTLAPGSVTRINVQSPFNTLSVKSFSAICPGGQRVLGGGAFTVGGIHAVITEMQPIHPTTGADSFEVTAAADQFGIPFSWSFQVFAFCAAVPRSMQLEIVSHTNLPTFGQFDDASVRCPPGKVVIGAGGKIDNGGGQVDLGTIPSDSTTVSALAKQDADGFAGSYTNTVYAVCAVPNVFTDIQTVISSVTSADSSQSAVLACPGGMELTGVAGDTALSGTHLQQIRPTQVNLAKFGAQSSVPPTVLWFLQYAVFCIR